MKISTSLKLSVLCFICMILCGTITARTYDETPDSYDTVSVCRSELPILYDTVSISDTGDYMISLISSLGLDSIVQLRVIVRENPEPHIFGMTSHCANATAFVYVESDFASYLWNTGHEVYYTMSSDTLCTVVVTDSTGCMGMDTLEFEILPVPELEISGENSLCYQDSTYLFAAGADYFIWYNRNNEGFSSSDTIKYIADTENGFIDTLYLRGNTEQGCFSEKPVYITIHPEYQTVDTVRICRSELPYHHLSVDYDTAGTYPVHYQSFFGCDSLVMMTLVIMENPEVQIIGADSLCEGLYTSLTASGAVSYLWNTQSSSLSIVAQPDQLYWLEGTDANGCISRDSIFVRSLPLPVVEIEGPSAICYGQSATLSATENYIYSWSTEKTTISITVQPAENTDYQVTVYNQHACSATASATVVVYPVYDTIINVTCCSNDLPYLYHNYSFNQGGNYTVPLTTINGCDSVIHLNLTVLESPYANISGNTEICPGASTQLSANGNGTFRWSTGSTRSPLTVTNTGWYLLTVTATNGCKAYDSVEVVHLPLPEMSISGADTICRGSEVLLIASGANSYSWNTGVVGAILTAEPSQSTMYMVTGTSDRGCTATATHSVRVNALPTATISGANAVCQGNTVTFTATGGTSYLWSTGETTAAVQLGTEQLYTVEVTNQYGCTATASKYLEVNDMPTVSIIGQDYFCEGGNTVLNATGIGAVSYIWNNSSIGQTYTVSMPGIYTVSATSSANCTATASVTVTQQNSPEISITGALAFCDGESTQLTARGAQQYAWRNSYGALIANTSTLNVSDGGVYSVTVTDSYGCSASQQVSVEKKNLPNATIIASNNEVCEGTPVSLRAGVSGYSYSWNTGATSQQIEVTTSGIYVLEVTANGCTASESVEIIVHPLPDIVFSGDTIITEGESATIYASAPQAASYHWSTGGNSNSILVTPAATTDYSVEVTSIYNCSNQKTVRVVVVSTPIIVGEDYFCEGDSTLLQAYGGVSYLWNDGVATASRYVSAAGTYSVTVTNSEGYTSSASKQIVQHNHVQLQINGENGFCAGDSVVLTATGADNLYWSNGKQGNQQVVYEAGIYTVNSSDVSVCALQAEKQVVLYNAPELEITGQTDICQNDPVTLTAVANESVTYSWNTGASGNTLTQYPQESTSYQVVATNNHQCTATASVDVHVTPIFETTVMASCCSNDLPYIYRGQEYMQSGIYDLHIQASEGCDSIIHFNFTVNESPYATISGILSICPGTGANTSTQLSANGNGNIRWSTGATNSPIIVNTTGWYMLTVTATNGCKAYDSVEVSYLPLPEVVVTGASSVCRGTDVELVASGANTYSWSTGHNGSVLTATPMNTATYVVTGTSAFGCSSTTTHTVTVNALPVASISGDNAICQGETSVFTANGGNHYLWSTGDTTASIQINDNQEYTVEVSNQFGCTSSASKSLVVNELPTVAILGQNYFCEGGSTVLNASATGAVSYLWNNSNIGPSYTVTQPGVYTVMVTSSANCTATASITVIQKNNPTITVNGELSFCDGQSTQLIATGGQQYSWENAMNTEISNIASVTLNEGGAYSVTVTDNFGCSSSEQVSVIKKNLPDATITASDNEVCDGTEVSLSTGLAQGYTYQWNTGATEHQITVTTSGKYVLQVTADGCSSKDSVMITVHPLPVISFTGDTEICQGSETTVNAVASNVASYQWSTGNTTSHISVSPDVTTDYEVQVTDVNGCVNQNTVRVIVDTLPTANIAGADSICEGSSTVLYASGGLFYQWNNGATDAERTVNESGTYTVVVFSAQGCSASAEKTVRYYDTPEINISGIQRFCMGDSAVLTAYGADTYLWSNASTDTHITVSESGLYIVEGWNTHACSSKDSIEVEVLPVPDVQISGSTHICVNEFDSLSAQSSTAISYLWNTGDTTARIQVDSADVYTVIVSDSNSCKAMASFTVDTFPTLECQILGKDRICQGDTMELTISAGEILYWSTQDTTTSILVAPNVTTTFSAVVRDENGCTSTVSKEVTVKEYEPIVINGSDGFCEGGSVLLVAHIDGELVWSNGQLGDSIVVHEAGEYAVWAQDSTACWLSASKQIEQYAFPEIQIEGTPYFCYGDTGTLYAVSNEEVSYLWNTGSTDSVISISTTNVYGVTVTNVHGCQSETSQLIMAYSAPTVNISGPTTVCNGSDAFLSTTGNATHFLWSTGDTTSSITETPSITTNYEVLATSDYGCTATAAWSVSVSPIPVVSITGDTSLCQGEVGVLTCSNANSFHWSTGSNNHSINVGTTGTYSVVVTNSAGCTNSASVHVQVYEHPQLMILGDTILCQGEQTELLAIGGSSFLWNDGSTTPNIHIAPSSNATYTVQAFNGACVAEMSRQVVVNARPTAAIVAPTGVCEGSTVALTAQGGYAYLWSTGQSSAMIDVSVSGEYQLIAYNEFGCTDTATHSLIQYPQPQVSIAGTSALCQGEQGVLTAVGTGTFLWNTSDTSSSIAINNPGFYQVQMTDVNGCVAYANQNVTALASPTIVITGPNDMCENDTVNLTVVYTNVASFSWNTGETGNTIEVSPNGNTTYSVIAISEDNCTAQQSHTLLVHPTYRFDFDAEICQGHSYSGQGFTVPVQQEAGEFTFTNPMQTVHGCDSVCVLHLTVNAVPVITNPISGNGTVTTPGNYVFMIDPVEGANSYEWILSNPNWTLSYNQTVAQVSIMYPGTATLSVYALNECGPSQPMSIQITYGVGIDDMEMTVVKVFPNPTNGFVNVQLTMNNEQLFSGEIQLLDMYGKLLNIWEMSGDDMQLDLSSYAAGVYMLKLRNTKNAMESTVKVVKQ